MDPQECLRRILEIAAMGNPSCDETDEYHELWKNLAIWLGYGGFAPTCSNIGRVRHSWDKGDCARRHIAGGEVATGYSSQPYAIMAENYLEPDNGPYVFVKYNHKGDEVARYKLPMSKGVKVTQ